MIPEPQVLVERVNRLKYPPTIWSHDWIYGVWYCSTSFKRAIYYGQYPSTFVKRIMAMFPGESMLHLCCGRCRIDGALNVDIKELPEVDLVSNVESMPLPDSIYEVALIDPPYSQLDAKRYKVPRLINSRAAMREISRVLVPGGYLLWLDEKYPTHRRRDWKLRGLIGIVTGAERRTRVLSIFQNLKLGAS